MNPIELFIQNECVPSIFQPSNILRNREHLKMHSKTCIINLFPFLFPATASLLHDRSPDILKHFFLTVKGIQTDQVLVLFNTFGAAYTGFVMELMIDLGCRRFILFGSAGIMQSRIAFGDIIIPTQCIRDEGISFHYLSPSRHVYADSTVTTRITEWLNRKRLTYHQGMHWTTDAPFRETPGKIERLSNAGCLSVDMETSALFAIGQSHGVSCLSFLVGLDRLAADGWSPPPKGRVKKVVTERYLSLMNFLDSRQSELTSGKNH